MAKNYAEKFSPKVVERFKQKSYTGGMASQAYTWDGVKTVNVYSVDTAPLYDYNRNAMTESRFGPLTDLSDHLQVMTVNQDKSFHYAVDAGDNAEQMGVKNANKSLTRQMDEVIYPYLDKFNFKTWIREAGQAIVASAAVDPNTALYLLYDATEALDEEAVPDTGRRLYVTTAFMKNLKKNPMFIYTDKLASESMIKGQIGELDGMPIIQVPTKYFPANVEALVFYKEAALAPMKLQHYKVHDETTNVDGQEVTGRILHDAFVLDGKAKAMVPICDSGIARTAAPTVANNGAINFTGMTVYYTTDGTDPRNSGTAIMTNANVAAPNAGTLVTAVGYNASNIVAWSATVQKQA